MAWSKSANLPQSLLFPWKHCSEAVLYLLLVSSTDRELKARDNLFVNEVLPPINTSNQMPTLGIKRFFPGMYIFSSFKKNRLPKKNSIGILSLPFGLMFIYTFIPFIWMGNRQTGNSFELYTAQDLTHLGICGYSKILIWTLWNCKIDRNNYCKSKIIEDWCFDGHTRE